MAKHIVTVTLQGRLTARRERPEDTKLQCFVCNQWVDPLNLQTEECEANTKKPVVVKEA